MHSTSLVRLGALLAGTSFASAQYLLETTYDASNFYNEFTFFTGADPTHGFVNYLDASDASAQGLAGTSNGQVYLGVDYQNAAPDGRSSVRVSSNAAYTQGLFIADIQHMPGSICGVWPAFWTFGPNWPSSGEIDIIEGVNTQTTDAVTLHTSNGCSMSNSGSAAGSVLSTSDCNGNDGCSQSTTAAYGTPFNNMAGGIYAMEWTDSQIAVWFFPRASIPDDITAGNPSPSGWGSPTTLFGGSDCSINEHFANHNLVFDTTFCGDWAGQVWGSNAQCSALSGSCTDYVANNPAVFDDAYWLINSIKVYSGAIDMKRSAANETIGGLVSAEKRAVKFEA